MQSARENAGWRKSSTESDEKSIAETGEQDVRLAALEASSRFDPQPGQAAHRVQSELYWTRQAVIACSVRPQQLEQQTRSWPLPVVAEVEREKIYI